MYLALNWKVCVKERKKERKEDSPEDKTIFQKKHCKIYSDFTTFIPGDTLS